MCHQTGHKPGKIADMGRFAGSVLDLLPLSLLTARGSWGHVSPAATVHTRTRTRTHTYTHAHTYTYAQNDSLPVTPGLWLVSCLMSQNVLIPQVSKCGSRQRHYARRMGLGLRKLFWFSLAHLLYCPWQFPMKLNKTLTVLCEKLSAFLLTGPLMIYTLLS